MHEIWGLLFVLSHLLIQALEKMEQEWSTVNFDVLPYKETGTYIFKSPDEASQLLDDHIVMTQSMSFSPFKKPFENRINTWETKLRLTQVRTHTHTQTHNKLRSCIIIRSVLCCATALFWCLQNVLEEWLTCQRSWLYLEPIFSSDDINQQLPVEGKRYQQMEQTWRGVMRSAFDNPKVRASTTVCTKGQMFCFT